MTCFPQEPLVSDMPVALVRDRMNRRHDSNIWGHHQAAKSLWDDEYASYHALSHMPALRGAAECAWERRNRAAAMTLLIADLL